MFFATSKIDGEFRKFNIICNVSNIIIYCCIDDSARKNETRRCKSLFKYIGEIKEKYDVYICKSVTVLVKLPDTRKKIYLKTLTDASTEALKKSKHCGILRLATKEKQMSSNLTNLCRKTSMA